MKSEILNLCDISVQLLNGIWNIIKKENMENEQIILDWLDKINEISVRN
jgi:hypothetical protein